VQLVATAREEYEEIIKHEVQVAIASDREELDRLCAKYVDNVRAYTTREKVLDPAGRAERSRRAPDALDRGEDRDPEARKDDFRHELMNYIAACTARARRSTTARTSGSSRRSSSRCSRTAATRSN
jgi:serine protein kinase